MFDWIEDGRLVHTDSFSESFILDFMPANDRLLSLDLILMDSGTEDQS